MVLSPWLVPLCRGDVHKLFSGHPFKKSKHTKNVMTYRFGRNAEVP